MVAFTFIGSMAVSNVNAKTTGKAGSDLENCVPAQNIEAIIDDSGSMRSSDSYRLRLAALELLINKPGNERKTLGSIEFGTWASSIFGPALIEEDKLDLLKRLDKRIRADNGSTNYNDAFRLAIEENANADAMIFLTDGGHNGRKFENLHKQAPETHVIGFFGSEGSSGQVRKKPVRKHRGKGQHNPGAQYQDYGEPLLKRIAEETMGKYYGNVTTDNLQAVFNEIDSRLNCESKPEQIEDTFDESDESAGRAKHHRLAIKKGANTANLVVTWPDPTKSMKVSSIRIVRRGKVVASTKPLKSTVNKLGITKAKGMTYQAIGIKNLVPGTLRYTLKLKKAKTKNIRNPYDHTYKTKKRHGNAAPKSSPTASSSPGIKNSERSSSTTNVITQLSQR